MNETKGTCLVTGVGPGTGAAIVRHFAEAGYSVAAMARDEARLTDLATEHARIHAYPCDVSNAAALMTSCDRIDADLGAPNVVIHNAVGGGWGSFLDIEPELLERNFQVNVMALLHLSRRTVPAMIEAGGGALVATGNTSAYRGKSFFAGFAPTKAAQRILMESIARDAGPKGVHAAYVAIDAVIDLEWTRKRFADRPDDFFCQPTDIAEEVYRIAHQPKSAWTFDSVIRPFGETW
ncbi:MAG: SDR family NAD(P)-dependent oxidoreductase [Pseudomonadales bacterium]|nr:SDR family NAD(P)-dependent oxidoreductase [Pseudomonadales bacterium]